MKKTLETEPVAVLPVSNLARVRCGSCSAPMVVDLGPANERAGSWPQFTCGGCRFTLLAGRCDRPINQPLDAASPEGLKTILALADEYRSRPEPLFNKTIAGAFDELANKVRSGGFAQQPEVGFFELGPTTQSFASFHAMNKAGATSADLRTMLDDHQHGKNGLLGHAVDLELDDAQMNGVVPLNTSAESARSIRTGSGLIESRYSLHATPQGDVKTIQIFTLLTPERNPRSQTIVRLVDQD